ncbi:efflux RND transporter permease subunit [Zafaria sp. J156]|uniref:efflux RND transporter permease subunit n=1 Tax=Zafaria sp. J156 TaxID=3116490 RepID=UPI002E76FEAC|nr:efflux RND transporter permease subunit [Zafaria sp. J156]MEE1620791.1 efflux RND transporter permease subunit [Zafaria sp. J156]
MHRLAELSLGNRALIALITVFASVFGVITMGSLKQELIPSLEFPQITVVAAMPGASPEVVDRQVGEPLENALQAVEGLESSSATSRTGLATINLAFTYGTNLDRARNQVDRAVANARQVLPDDVEPSSFAGSIADFPVVYLAVAGGDSLNGLKADLERLTVPKLRKVDGVRTVDVTGGATQHIAVLPRAADLAAAGATVADIATALDENAGLFPIGSVGQEGLTLPVQAGTDIASLDDVRGLPLSIEGRDDVSVIGDVASVEIVDDEPTSVTRTNGEETLALALTKTPDGDTVAISHAVAELLPSLQAELGGDAVFTTVFDQAPFIEKSIKDLTTEGLLGLGFAVLVILVFLLSVRSTLVTAVSIPLSLLVTFIGLNAFGYSLNILTLGALTISIGRVVDDSIVVIENIKRHLAYGEDKVTAIRTAVREVATAITAATLTTVAVFLPVAFVGDLAGELFRPFALTMTLALVASLLVSLTIVPVLAYWFLGRGHASPAADDAGAPRAAAAARERALERERGSWLQRGYSPVLDSTQRHPVITLTAAVLLLAGTVAMVPLLPTNLLGSSGQNSFSVVQELPAGSSLQTTLDAALPVEEALRAGDGIRDVQLTVGNPSGGFASFGAGTDRAQFTVITEEGRDVEELIDAVRPAVEAAAGGTAPRFSTQEGGFGTSSTVDVDITAPTPELLEEAAAVVEERLAGIEGARGVESDLVASRPQVSVTVDPAEAARRGLTDQQIGGLAASALAPLPAGSVRLGFTEYPVAIGEGGSAGTVEELRALAIPTPQGPVELGDIAAVEVVEAPASVSSANGERIATVSVTPGENDLGGVAAEVTGRIDALELPEGAAATVGGAATQQAESFEQLYLALLAAVAIVYVIMVATFKSLAQPLILLVSVPFAATGAIGLLLVTGVPLGLPSLIGMLMLVGIVVTNAIVLIDLINQYRKPGPGRAAMPLDDAIHQGARQRLRPILMTALATIFALTPMALGITGEGGFISQPLAVVVIGGLVSSTALTLVLVPVLYRLLEVRRERRNTARRAPRHAAA